MSNENNEGPGCLGAILLVFMFFLLAPPLGLVAWDFWFEMSCQYKGWMCDHKHLLDWNFK